MKESKKCGVGEYDDLDKIKEIILSFKESIESGDANKKMIKKLIILLLDAIFNNAQIHTIDWWIYGWENDKVDKLIYYNMDRIRDVEISPAQAYMQFLGSNKATNFINTDILSFVPSKENDSGKRLRICLTEIDDLVGYILYL